MNPKDAFGTFKTFPQLESNQLLLRKIKPSDAEDIFLFMSDEGTVKNFLIAPHKTIEETLKQIKTSNKLYEKKKQIQWGVTKKGSSAVIGTIGFHNLNVRDFQTEVGGLLSRPYWRGGIMTEALLTILTFGFEKMAFNRIYGLIHPDNIASISLGEKVGFRKEGLLREGRFFNNQFYDLALYSLLKKDYMSSSNLP
jgi:ribosomal-protein-alanine N-acetyltransferase